MSITDLTPDPGAAAPNNSADRLLWAAIVLAAAGALFYALTSRRSREAREAADRAEYYTLHAAAHADQSALAQRAAELALEQRAAELALEQARGAQPPAADTTTTTTTEGTHDAAGPANSAA